MRIIGYAYDADHHCVSCTVKRFGLYRLGNAEWVSTTATDSEGNPVHALFSTDEWYEPSLVQVQVCTCADCGAEMDRYEPWDAIEDDARAEGYAVGKNAAGWYWDGRSTDADYRRVLQGIEDGDPAVYDTFPCSPLSGEWAGDLLPSELCAAYGVFDGDDGWDDICAAYEDGYSAGVVEEIERVAIFQTADN